MRMSFFFRIFLLSALALPALVSAQQTAVKKTSTSASKPHTLTVDGVLAMVKAGLSDDVIVARQ